MFDACVELPCSFVKEEQLTALRPELAVDSDLVMILLQLSLVSPIYFDGIRVQFMLGAGDTVGNSPAWMAPENRLSERFCKTPRAALQDAVRDVAKDGNGALLVEKLAARGKVIGDVDSMSLPFLRGLCLGCFTSSFEHVTVDQLRGIIKRLHAYYLSDEYPNRSSCSKLFIGPGSGDTIGVMGAFTPNGVMVGHKVVHPREGPQDVSDMVGTMVQPPDLVIYDLPCQMVTHLERRRPGLLENVGKLPRLADGGGVAAAAGGIGESGEGWVAVKESSLPRVSIRKLAHMGCGTASVGTEIRKSSTPVVHVRSSSADVYALKAASSPQPAAVQSQVDLYALLHTSGEALGRVEKLNYSAAMRAVSAIRRGGVRILSLFEVLVFTYYWHHEARDDRLGLPVLGADGWALQLPSPDSDASPAGSGEGSLVEGKVQGAQAQVDGEGIDESTAPVNIAEAAKCLREGVDESMAPVNNAETAECLREAVNESMAPVNNAEAAKCLRELLVVAVGATDGKLPCLPQLSRDLLMDEKTSSPFVTVIEGLRAYAQAKEDFFVDGLQPAGMEERMRAGAAVRAGIGFGDSVFSVKALQLALATGVVPHESAKDGKVFGYGTSFHDTTYDDSDLVVPGEGRRPHPYTAQTCGMYVSADGPNEEEHNDQCRCTYGGMERCMELAGLEFHPREQSRSHKAARFPSVATMVLPNFTYALRVINELQNEACNKYLLGCMLGLADNHRDGRVTACHNSLWACGRCFCAKPLMRRFDRFGRLGLVHLRGILSRAHNR